MPLNMGLFQLYVYGIMIKNSAKYLLEVNNKQRQWNLSTNLPGSLKDSHREKSLLNKTPTRTKRMNMNIWVVGTSNQIFKRGS